VSGGLGGCPHCAGQSGWQDTAPAAATSSACLLMQTNSMHPARSWCSLLEGLSTSVVVLVGCQRAQPCSTP
jgi:hypothetical protein